MELEKERLAQLESTLRCLVPMSFCVFSSAVSMPAVKITEISADGNISQNRRIDGFRGRTRNYTQLGHSNHTGVSAVSLERPGMLARADGCRCS